MAQRKSGKHGGAVNTLIHILLFPIYLICKFYPKNKKLYAFGSRHGADFADNSKYLFLYASRNVKDVRCVFFSRNRQVVEDLNKSGYEACHTNSWAGIKTAIRAKKCFISHSTHDIHMLLIGGAEIIQLWHGTPLKKICYDVRPANVNRASRLKNILRPIIYAIFPYLNVSMKFSRIVISSEKIKENYLSAFRIEDKKIAVLGQPRNDAMAEDYRFDRALFPELDHLEKLKSDFKNIITYMPTHRLISGGGIANLVSGFGFESNKLKKFLIESDSRLIIKAHFLDATDLKEALGADNHITIHKYADPYPLLKYTDILITDYSSVYFDYLLLNRPILFAPFDYDTYMKDDASFYHDYDKVTPGEKCRNWDELLNGLARTMKDLSNKAPDPFDEKRKEINELFNDFSFGNCARVVKEYF